MIEFILDNTVIIYSVLGVLLMGLSIYLGFLLKLIKAQKIKKSEDEAYLAEVFEEKRKNHKESVIFIARATLQGQCELSEACIRIKNLMDIFSEYKFHEAMAPVHMFYNELSSFAYLEERNSLPKQEIYEQDKKRFKVEEKYKSEFTNSLESLITLLDK